MAVTLNEQQRAAADLTHNAVVAAGAGSGKTTVLAERYLRLITQERLPVEKILCLTFTKKAANEMRRRIYRELRTFAHDAPEGGKAAAEAAVRGFYGARIQTLDSYCAQVVRSAASRYGISPDFSEDAERARAIIDEEALPFLLGCGNHPALSVLYQVKKIDEIAEGFFVAPLKNYASIDDDGSFTGGIVRQFKHISQQDTWQEDIQVVNECLDVINAQKYGADGIYTEKLNISFDELSAYFAMIQECTEHECIEKSYNHAIYKKMIHYLIMLYHICEISLVKTKGDAKDALKTIRRRFMRLSALFVFCAQAGFMYALSHLQQRFFDIIVERKRREGVLDFKDAAVLARKILIEQKDIRQSEKSAFSAIIIDEFQDNNELQKDMLFLLAEKEDICGGGVPAPEDLCPSKLFFVGDEKQSIYKFRGADVSVFRALQRTFGGSFPLSANYRSNERLIAAFNAIFGGLLPEGGGDSGCPALFIKSSGGGGGTVNNLRKSEGGGAPLAPAAAAAPSSAAPHAGALPPQRPRLFPAPAGSGCAAPDFEAV
ncbi:MAG: UvrD-helicase domain-containing protein, partial [Spirochaetaceae bacterium]|nr:UvrD-helicase domain-containing protein [Spirochaetaceae bacterium]